MNCVWGNENLIYIKKELYIKNRAYISKGQTKPTPKNENNCIVFAIYEEMKEVAPKEHDNNH